MLNHAHQGGRRALQVVYFGSYEYDEQVHSLLVQQKDVAVRVRPALFSHWQLSAACRAAGVPQHCGTCCS
jgi:hypothetical protein